MLAEKGHSKHSFVQPKKVNGGVLHVKQTFYKKQKFPLEGKGQWSTFQDCGRGLDSS